MFRAWAELVVRRPRLFVGASLLAVVLLGLEARHLRLDLRERDQLPQQHPYVQLYNEINERFGGGAVVLIGVIARHGTVFTPDRLAKVQRLTRTITALPELRGGSVLSIAAERVKALRPTADGVDVVPLMETVPADQTAADHLRGEVYSDPLYVGTLVSADGSAAAILAEVAVDTPYGALVETLEGIAAPERDASTDIVLGGSPVLLAQLDRYTVQMGFFLPLAVVVIAAAHYDAFRTVQAMVLPLVTALLSVVSALGIMGAFGAPIDTWSSATPVALLAVAAGHAVQMLKRYYEEYALAHDNAQAVRESLAKSAPVMLTAGAIAAGGFTSLATFGIASVRVFGLLMAFGILAALALEMTFTPACRVLLPAPRSRETRRERESSWSATVVAFLSRQVLRHPWQVIGVAAVVVIVGAEGSSLLVVDNSIRAWLPARSTARRDDRVINAKFGGASTLKLLVVGDYDGALQEPDVLRALADLGSFLRQTPEIGKTVSLADYIERLHRVFDERAAAAEPLPWSRSLVAQYLLLYSLSGTDDLSGFVDASARHGVVLALSKSDGARFAEDLFKRTRTFVAERFAGLPARVGIAGGSLGAQAAVNETVVQEKVRNMLQISGIIFLLSALILQSFVGGLLVLTPVGLALAVTLGLLGWVGTPLSMSTSAVTAMGVSLGADFAVYLIFRCREEIGGHDTFVAGLERALLTSGKAVFFVSSAVTLGYLVLVLSGFKPWVQLGGLTALIMAVSAVGAVSVLPALLLVLRPRFLLPGASRGAASGRPQSPPPISSTS